MLRQKLLKTVFVHLKHEELKHLENDKTWVWLEITLIEKYILEYEMFLFIYQNVGCDNDLSRNAVLLYRLLKF